MLTGKQFDKAFYQALKTETKKRKMKLSAEHDIYKRIDPYFFNVFYASMHYKDTEGKVVFMFDVSVKYHRFDELQYGILHPGNDLHFTDKIRANSGALSELRQAICIPYNETSADNYLLSTLL